LNKTKLNWYHFLTAEKKDFDELDDQKLISLTKSGNKHAFGILVRRYMQRAYYVALGFIGSHEDALDMSQEAFVRAYRAIKKFETGKQFFTWYYQILHNLCFNLLRSRKIAAFNFSELSEHEILHKTDDNVGRPDEIYEQKEMQQKLWEAINKLSESGREIILLREFQDYSYEEIARLFDCPVGTVMSRLYYARKKLAEELRGKI